MTSNLLVRTFKKTPKQIQAIDLMARYIEVNLSGGSRSGKTFIIVYAIIVRALKYPGSRHLIARKHLNHLKSIITQTVPDVNKKAFNGALEFEFNRQQQIYTFLNESVIYLVGTEDKERLEKALGFEYSTIFINEISQMNFNIYETLKTRLNPDPGIKPLLISDLNPSSKRHFIYQMFYKKLNPETKEPIQDPDRYATLQMNPAENVQNLSADYIKTLESMSESKRKRFLRGEFSDDSDDALWKWEWIANNRKNEIPENLEKIVVGVDPAVTGKETSDDTGIIVAGRIKQGPDYHYYILADCTIHGDVTGWGRAVVAAYKKYMADRVIGEVNQGGDLVEMNIRNYDRNICYSDVRATRGKAKRAEPIADLYERNLVHHVGEFQDVEDQMCTWTPESNDSPDNMDALVWALTYLSDNVSDDWAVGVA
jgi:phage terminase large subunit-like protein